MGRAPFIVGAHVAPAAAPQVTALDICGAGCGTLKAAAAHFPFPQVSACRTGAAPVPQLHARAAVSRRSRLQPLRLVPSRPAGHLMSTDATPCLAHVDLTASPVMSE